DAVADLFEVGSQHDQVDVAFRGRGRLPLHRQGQPGQAGLERDGRVMAFPDDALAGAPGPPHLRFELLTKSPDLEVVTRSVEPIEQGLAALFDFQAKLRFEPVSGLIADQGEILTGPRHLDRNARRSSVALLWGREVRLPAEKRVGERGCVVTGKS